VLKQVENIIYNDGAIVPLQWQHLSWAARKNVEIKPVLSPLDMPYLGDLVIK
jgi:peptide/nickel transport system substrate-binding protein